MKQAKLNLKDAGLVHSQNKVELMAGSYLLVTSSPILSLNSLFINLLKESNLTVSGLLAGCQKPVLPLRLQEKCLEIFTGNFHREHRNSCPPLLLGSVTGKIQMLKHQEAALIIHSFAHSFIHSVDAILTQVRYYKYEQNQCALHPCRIMPDN